MPCRIYESKITDEDRITFFTRTGESRPFVMPEPEEKLTPKNFFHDFPAKDQANKNVLLEGNDETETIRLNNRAGILLSDIRGWVLATQHDNPYGAGHNGTGVETKADDSNTGYGMEMRHDSGPSVLNYDKKSKTYRSGMKERYEAGSPVKAKLGEPWITGKVVTLKSSEDGAKQLHQVGNMKFNFSAHQSALIKSGWRWQQYGTIQTLPKGKKYEEPVSIQGLIVAQKAEANSDLDDTAYTRGAASNYDAVPGSIADDNERENAHAKLDRIADLLTPKLYDALIAAAMGDTFDEIGRKFMPGLSTTDRRPGVKGKTLVIDALEILILREFRMAA